MCEKRVSAKLTNKNRLGQKQIRAAGDRNSQPRRKFTELEVKGDRLHPIQRLTDLGRACCRGDSSLR